MIVKDILYRGQSELLTLVLKDDGGNPLAFEDVDQITVSVFINKVLQVSFTKTDEEVLPVDGEANQCKVPIGPNLTQDWPTGLMELRIRLHDADDDFDTGRVDIVMVPYKIVK